MLGGWASNQKTDGVGFSSDDRSGDFVAAIPEAVGQTQDMPTGVFTDSQCFTLVVQND